MKKAVCTVAAFVASFMAGAGIVGNFMLKNVNKSQEMSEKHLSLYMITNDWLRLKQDGKDMATYFKRKDYKKIAIYGMHYMGMSLLNELKNSGIEVAYGIDRNAGHIFADCKVITPDEEFEDVDAIVVTPVFYFESIEEELSQKVSYPIVSLEEVLYGADLS